MAEGRGAGPAGGLVCYDLVFPRRAGVAQLVEQLIRNQQVLGSSPSAGSKLPKKTYLFSASAKASGSFDALAVTDAQQRVHPLRGLRRGLLYEVRVQGRGDAQLGHFH